MRYIYSVVSWQLSHYFSLCFMLLLGTFWTSWSRRWWTSSGAPICRIIVGVYLLEIIRTYFVLCSTIYWLCDTLHDYIESVVLLVRVATCPSRSASRCRCAQLSTCSQTPPTTRPWRPPRWLSRLPSLWCAVAARELFIWAGGA